MTGPGPAAGYVGREIELERLGRLLERAVDGQGGLVVIRAESGMGATRTAYEVAARADRLGMVTLWGSFIEGLGGRPFGALADALEEFGAGLPAVDLRGQLGSGAAALARMCPRLRDVLPDIPPAAPLDASDERLRLYDAAVGWLTRASAERPLLLVLDNVNWADEDTLGLLSHVSRAAGSLALSIVATDNGSAPAAGEVVALGGLDEGALSTILTELAQRPLPASVVSAIHGASGGHPLFARELYRHLAEEDQLAAGRLPPADELPATLDAVIKWRLSRLSLETRNVLGALACFPLGVAPGLLAEVTGLPRARVIEDVERAVSADIVRPTERGRHYAIYHERIRRALYDATPARVRSAIHRRAAAALEAEYGEDVRAHAAEIVGLVHAASAVDAAGGADPATLRHVLVGAEQARTAGAYRRAATLLAFAVKLFGEGRRTDYVELVARRAVAEVEAGMTAAAAASVRELLGGQRRHGSLTREAWDDVVVGLRGLRHAGEAALAAQLARLALAEGGARDELLRARLQMLSEEWTEVDSNGIRWQAWQTDEGGAPSLLTQRGDESDKADLLLVQRTRGPADIARLGPEVTRWHRPTSALAGLRGLTTDLLSKFGQFREAATAAGRYLAAAERFGSLRDVAEALLLLAQARAILGELQTAGEILAAADDTLARIPSSQDLVANRLLAELTLAHYREADWPALTDNIVAARSGPAQPAGLLFAAEEAQANARSGRESEARELVAALMLTLGEVQPLRYLRDAALFGTLTAAWEMGAAEHAVAGRVLVERAAAAGAGGSHVATPRLALARLHGLSGNVGDARADFARERPMLDGAGLRPLRAMADYDEAITIAAAGTGFGEAGALLEQAFRQFQGLGMLGWARRTEALQASGFEFAAEPGGRLHFSYPAGLSRREADVVRLLASGTTPAQAAAELEVDESVFSRHLASALEKLGAASLDELPRFARHFGLGGA